MGDPEVEAGGQADESMEHAALYADLGRETEAISVPESSYRELGRFGKIYDDLRSGEAVNIAAFDKITIEIDVENLGLDKVSPESLERAWERDRDGFTQSCEEAGIKLDPFTVYKYYRIQRKTFEVLGPPIENPEHRRRILLESDDRVKLSEMRGNAMCSEYALLSTFIAQRIGEPAHLVIGSVVLGSDADQWRGAHAYGWIEGVGVFDSVQATQAGEFPALMIPSSPTAEQDLAAGADIECTRIGVDFKANYGSEAGGFGLIRPEPSQ